MSDEERKALVGKIRKEVCNCHICGLCGWKPKRAADQLEADGQRIAELEAALRGLLGMWSTRTVDYARAALGDKG